MRWYLQYYSHVREDKLLTFGIIKRLSTTVSISREILVSGKTPYIIWFRPASLFSDFCFNILNIFHILKGAVVATLCQNEAEVKFPRKFPPDFTHRKSRDNVSDCETCQSFELFCVGEDLVSC